MERLVILYSLVQREEIVDRSLQDQGWHLHSREELGGSAAVEEGDRLSVDGACRVHLVVSCGDLGVEFCGGRHARENVRPTSLRGLVFVEARPERMPGNSRGYGIDPTVPLGRGELDAAAVGLADHAHSRHARPVQQDAPLLRDPIEHFRDVPSLEVRAVDLGLPSRVAEAPGIPRQDVEPTLPELGDAQRSLDPGLRRVGIAGRAPARTHEHSRVRVPARVQRIRKPVDTDGRAVEGGEVVIRRDAGHMCRLGRLPASGWLTIPRSCCRRV